MSNTKTQTQVAIQKNETGKAVHTSASNNKNKENKMANKKQENNMKVHVDNNKKKKIMLSPKKRPQGPHNENFSVSPPQIVIPPNSFIVCPPHGEKIPLSKSPYNVQSIHGSPQYIGSMCGVQGTHISRHQGYNNPMFFPPNAKPLYPPYPSGFPRNLSPRHQRNGSPNHNNQRTISPAHHRHVSPVHYQRHDWMNMNMNNGNNNNKNNRNNRRNSYPRRNAYGMSTDNLVQIKTSSNLAMAHSPQPLAHSPPTSPTRSNPENRAPTPVEARTPTTTSGSDARSSQRSNSLERSNLRPDSVKSQSMPVELPPSPSQMSRSVRSEGSNNIQNYSNYGYHADGRNANKLYPYYPEQQVYEGNGIIFAKDGSMDSNAIGYVDNFKSRNVDRNGNNNSTSRSSSYDNNTNTQYTQTPYSVVLKFHQVQRSDSKTAGTNQHPEHNQPTIIMPDRFLARSHLLTMKNPPRGLMNGTKWDPISEGIWGKFYQFQQSEDNYKQKMHLWRNLFIMIKRMNPGHDLYVVGSTISGFGTDTSDVDMCLVDKSVIFNVNKENEKDEATKQLEGIQAHLENNKAFEDFRLIHARVPILRFKQKETGIEIDLNFNNPIGIRNTHLLYCYSKMDWRLRPLVLIVKMWARAQKINDARNSTLSSYSLVLMVIHYLQCGTQHAPVLPCLHKMYPDKFLSTNDISTIDINEDLTQFRSENRQTLGELFLGFLSYYRTFDFYHYAISIRLGSTVPVDHCKFAKSDKNEPRQWERFIRIEEPFDLTNTAHSVYEIASFNRIRWAMMGSYDILHETMNIESVFAELYPAIPPPIVFQFNGLQSYPEHIHTTKETMHARA